MSLETLLPALMFVALATLLFSGYPVAFVLGGTAIAAAAVGIALDVFFDRAARRDSRRASSEDSLKT